MDKLYDDMFTLGGFADEPEDIDGDFEAFNRCLADEYMGAFYCEEFSSIGYINNNLLETIVEWSRDEKAKGILDGSFVTCKNRTLIDACFDCRYGCLAEIYLYKGIFSPKLVVAILFSNEDIEPSAIMDIDENIGLVTQEQFDKRMKDLFDFIQKFYEENKGNIMINEYLLAIKNNYGRMHASKQHKHNVKPNEYGWCKRIGELYGKKGH